MPQPRQPFLHDLVAVLAAPTQAWSAASGDIGVDGRAERIQGVLHGDVRVLCVVALTADGARTEHLATTTDDEGSRFTSVFRYAEGMTGHPDRLIRIDRTRRVRPGTYTESIRVESLNPDPVSFDLGIDLGYDLAAMVQIKRDACGPLQPFPTGLPLTWGDQDVSATLEATGATITQQSEPPLARIAWRIDLAPGQTHEVEWSVQITDHSGVVVDAPQPGLSTRDALAALGPSAVADRRVDAWLRRALADLNGMRMAARQHPGDPFFAAGAPWYLTLFGRDSLWTARMLLPVDTRHAVGTLRTLARLAGTELDHHTGQAPGKIAHELRRTVTVLHGAVLPPLYYGTIDATPLWVCLLTETWRNGALADSVLDDLLPALEAALRWIVGHGDADGDGFVEYIDHSGRGLANQGWKDSADAVRFADGRIATGPVALCEVQGYAYEAVTTGADLLDAVGRTGAADYRAWADRLATQFRSRFWCGTGERRYPALALDGHKRQVDALTSNIGHLLGTGLLAPDEEERIARLLSGPELDSGLGLRTMSVSDGGYQPLSYHCGSVWPHDTAIVVAGLQRAGLGEHAAGLVDGLIEASVAFDGRLPELWSGEGAPIPYPSACRPQAWSAAAAVVVARWLAEYRP